MTTTDRECPNGHPVDATTVFCTQCGASAADGAGARACAYGHDLGPNDAYCPQCGTQPRSSFPGFVAASPPPPPPYGYASAGPYVGTQPGYAPAYVYMPPRGTNGLAIASLVVSLVPVCGVNAIVALVLGIIALNQLKSTHQDGRGLAIAGIVIASVQLVLGVAYLILILVVVSHGATTSSSSLVLHAAHLGASMLGPDRIR